MPVASRLPTGGMLISGRPILQLAHNIELGSSVDA